MPDPVLPWCTDGNVLPLDAEQFEWDDANRAHVREAGIEPEEAEEALLDPQRVTHDVYNLGVNAGAASSARQRPATCFSSSSPSGKDGSASSLRALPPRERSAVSGDGGSNDVR